MKKSLFASALLSVTVASAALPEKNLPSQHFASPPHYPIRQENASYLYDDSAGSGNFYEKWIANKLSFGLGISSFSLTKEKRPESTSRDFLGFINELNTVNGTKVTPTIDYCPCDYLKFGLTYLDIEAGTRNFNNHLGDGTAELSGPTLTVEIKYPLWEKRIAPHLGIGFAFLQGDFHEYTWWRQGYSNPAAWEAAGKPSSGTAKGNYRYIDVDDITKAYFTIGVSFQPWRRVKIDASYCRLSLDTDCEFGYEAGGHRDKRAEGDFDMSGDMWLFSIAYVF